MARQNLKLTLISDLLKNNFTVDEVLALSTKNLSPEGIKLGKKTASLSEEQVKNLGLYVKKNKEKISEFLFPSLNGGQLTKANFFLGFRKFVKDRGEQLSDYGIVSTRARRPKLELNSMQQILDFLK